MNLILTEIQTLTATEDMKCEASQIFWALPRPINYSMATLADAQLLFKGRFGKIKEGEKYLVLDFVDEDGELLTFRCLACMNKFLFRLGLYTSEIQEALTNFRKDYRLNQTIQ